MATLEDVEAAYIDLYPAAEGVAAQEAGDFRVSIVDGRIQPQPPDDPPPPPDLTPPVYVSRRQGSGNAIAVPDGIEDGDLVLMFVGSQGVGQTNVSGFDVVRYFTAGTFHSGTVLARVAADEPESYSLSTNHSGQTVLVVVFRGARLLTDEFDDVVQQYQASQDSPYSYTLAVQAVDPGPAFWLSFFLGYATTNSTPSGSEQSDGLGSATPFNVRFNVYGGYDPDDPASAPEQTWSGTGTSTRRSAVLRLFTIAEEP